MKFVSFYSISAAERYNWVMQSSSLKIVRVLPKKLLEYHVMCFYNLTFIICCVSSKNVVNINILKLL